MNFSATTLSAILATIISAGILALIAVAWRKRGWLREKWFNKKESKQQTIEVDKFVRNIKRWKCQDLQGISLSITERDFTTKHEKIIEIGFIRRATPELSMLLLKFSESSRVKHRTVFVTEAEFIRVCRLIYFKEVSGWKHRQSK